MYTYNMRQRKNSDMVKDTCIVFLKTQVFVGFLKESRERCSIYIFRESILGHGMVHFMVINQQK